MTVKCHVRYFVHRKDTRSIFFSRYSSTQSKSSADGRSLLKERIGHTQWSISINAMPTYGDK